MYTSIYVLSYINIYYTTLLNIYVGRNIELPNFILHENTLPHITAYRENIIKSNLSQMGTRILY
jgi:hypothetical protein